MTYPNPSTALARVVIDELVRGGCRTFVASPGSRSTALVLAATGHPQAELIMAIDERSAAFNALGRAKASGRPGTVITTSGTAVGNLMPAVIEADLSEAPLVVVTSDRPPEMRGVGANQTIDQAGLFGRFVRREIDTGPGEPRSGAPGWWRSMVSQLVAWALGFGGTPGPVHLNLPFREPTVPVSDDGRTRDEPYSYPAEGREGGRPWTAALVASAPSPDLVRELTTRLTAARRGLIVAGGGKPAPSVPELGRRLGWPVAATAESGVRGEPGTIATGHQLSYHVRPELILRFGAPGPSRRLLELLASDIPQIVVGSTWSDPARNAEMMVDAASEPLAAALTETVEPDPDREWLEWWKAADAAVRQALGPELSTVYGEPAIAAAAAASGADRLTVASSMPIRDIESYAFSVPPIVANRGASGIDGFVSTALGASAGAERPLALAGDLSFLHDANGFLVDPPGRCVFVVVDNGGGGIFSFLPQAQHVGDDFEALFATPHGRRLTDLAEFHRLTHREVDSLGDLATAIRHGWESELSTVVVARTDRSANVADHDRLARLADDAVKGVTASRPEA